MIPQIPLGTDGPQLAQLGLGCMGMSEFYGETDDARSLSPKLGDVRELRR